MKKLPLQISKCLFVVLLFLGFQALAADGDTCSTAILLDSPSDTVAVRLDTITGDEMWFKLVAEDDLPFVWMQEVDKDGEYDIHTLSIYEHSCGTLSLLTKDTINGNEDSIMATGNFSYAEDSTYYLKIERLSSDTTGFKIYYKKYKSSSGGCSRTAPCSFIANMGFEDHANSPSCSAGNETFLNSSFAQEK